MAALRWPWARHRPQEAARATKVEEHKAVLLHAIRAAYDAAQSQRRLTSWQPSTLGPQRRVAAGHRIVRSRSRDLARNNLTARAAFDRWVSTLIGSGIAAKPLCADAALRRQLVTMWESWSDACDYDGQTDYYGLQSLAVRSMLEGGEMLLRLVPSRAAGIELQLQALEGEHLSYKSEPRLTAGGKIIDGVEFDAQGRRAAYWVHPQHPGDNAGADNEPRRIPAAQIIHLFEGLAPGQVRGVPNQATTMIKQRDLEEFDDATLQRQKLANLFVGFITRPPPDQSMADDQFAQLLSAISRLTPGDESLASEMVNAWRGSLQSGGITGLEPGIVEEMLPGEDLKFSTPPGVSSEYDKYMREQRQQIGAGLGIPYSVLMFDFRGENDRTVRVALNEFRRHARQRINNTLVPQICRRVREAWFDAAILAGVLPTDVPDMRATRWTPDAHAYIHPVQDVTARAMEIKHGLASRSGALLDRGIDADLLDEEIAQDHERERRLGLRFDASTSDEEVSLQAKDQPAPNDLSTD